MATAIPGVPPSYRTGRLITLWQNSIGKKALMAVTGAVLFAYVLVHLLGNLQVHLGRAKLNGYAAFLKSSPGLLWTVRIVLLASVVVHATAGVALYVAKRRARPVPYAFERFAQAANASSPQGGLGLGLAIVKHLVELHGGTISAESPGEGLGATFTVLLPAHAGTRSSPRQRFPPRTRQTPGARSTSPVYASSGAMPPRSRGSLRA